MTTVEIHQFIKKKIEEKGGICGEIHEAAKGIITVFTASIVDKIGEVIDAVTVIVNSDHSYILFLGVQEAYETNT